MKSIFLIFNTIFIFGYAGLVFAVLYHYKKYSLPSDKYRFVIYIFLAIATILFILSYILILFFIPFEQLSF